MDKTLQKMNTELHCTTIKNTTLSDNSIYLLQKESKKETQFLTALKTINSKKYSICAPIHLLIKQKKSQKVLCGKNITRMNIKYIFITEDCFLYRIFQFLAKPHENACKHFSKHVICNGISKTNYILYMYLNEIRTTSSFIRFFTYSYFFDKCIR